MPSRGFQPRVPKHGPEPPWPPCSPLPAPCSVFNILTDRELAPMFGPRSVPYALGGRSHMMTEHSVRSSLLRCTAARPAPARPAAPSLCSGLLPAPCSLLLLVLLLGASSTVAQIPTPAQAPQALQQAVS